jgi:PEP-CTERM motif
MTPKPVLAAITLATIVFSMTPAGAAQIVPSSGFLPTYAGPQNGDFNITSGEAFLHNGTFEFDAAFSDPIGTTNGVFYVWGIDRGLNLAPFGANRPGVLFDSVVISAPSLNESFVLDLVSNQMTPLTGTAVDVSGNTLKLFVPDSLLPSEGFSDSHYLVNLWTRDGLNSADFTQIAEFAPSNSDVGVTVPEPATWAMLLVGLGAMGFMMRGLRSKGPIPTA